MKTEEVDEKILQATPMNTIRRNKWATSLFYTWFNGRIAMDEMDVAFKSNMDNIDICDFSIDQLNHWLPKFLFEVRKRDGSLYPQSTLVSLLAGLQSHLAQRGKPFQFFSDQKFQKIKSSLDSAMKRSVAENVGVHRNHIEIITKNEEEQLWAAGELGSNDAVQLQQTLFFFNGLHFGMRGGEEHRRLAIDQFQIKSSDDGISYIEYFEKPGKTYKGGLNQRKVSPTVKRFHANIDDPHKCHVELFKKFLKVRPNDTSAFYLQVRNSSKAVGNIWYTRRPLGHNSL